jgi:hypothetical protein
VFLGVAASAIPVGGFEWTPVHSTFSEVDRCPLVGECIELFRQLTSIPFLEFTRVFVN